MGQMAHIYSVFQRKEKKNLAFTVLLQDSSFVLHSTVASDLRETI